MNKWFTGWLWVCFFGIQNHAISQTWESLQPGFNATEYKDMLWLAFYGMSDSLMKQQNFTLENGQYQRLYRSPEVGLYNRAEIYLRSDSVVILSLRGTIKQQDSWLENFYAGMIPASGSLQLSSDYKFEYRFAENDKASVHIGWALGTGFLVREYLPVMEALIKRGLRKIIVTGHSQGGALSFLNTSYLYYYFREKYADLQWKTYASAAPKPGNLFYAYDFDAITGPGYAYRIVNEQDWVPETPITVQGLGDFNEVNPFTNAKDVIQKQKFPARVALNYMFKSMRNGSRKAAKRYKRFLGKGVGKQVAKKLPGFVPPDYLQQNNYSTAGAPVILKGSKAYQEKFVFDGNNVFLHHNYAPYLFLLNEFMQSSASGK